MKTNYLLPHKYKILGWILFIIGIIYGLIFAYSGYDYEPIQIKVLSIFNEGLLDGNDLQLFEIIETGISSELASIAIIVGGLIVGFSKEKIEDEFIYKLRKDSLVWAIIFNYFILTLTIIFIYDLSFFHVLIYNMFTPLLFFIIRFNFLKLKSKSHEE
jgi:H+/gluconate symporter-like permease